MCIRDRYKPAIDAEADEVRAAGGLFIIGTERHESRRIDNQLRGRAGRQGDPGASRFYLSLEDDLMRLFGGDRVQSLMGTLGIDEDTPIENRMITSTIETAQKKLEGRNFEIRKNVLKYDDVMNQQREIIYGQRHKVLNGEDISAEMHNMLKENKMCIRDSLYDLGYTRTTMALNKEKQDREVEQNSETTSQFGLQAATRPVSYTHLILHYTGLPVMCDRSSAG